MTAGRAIDHVVIAVRDLDAAAGAVEALGFTVTPRAAHPDHMGTSNRLVQFANRSFIELLEIDRPHLQVGHDFAASPPRFSFGAHAKAFMETGTGMAGLVLATDDARADIERFQAAGVETYAPQDFERRATLPDGSESTVAFSLAFATNPAMPGIVFFTCQNRFPENFWKPAFQSHANGATGIAGVTMVDDDPARHADFLGRLTDSTPEPIAGGIRIPCGAEQSLSVVTPDTLDQQPPATTRPMPYFASMTLAGSDNGHDLTEASKACGIMLAWRKHADT